MSCFGVTVFSCPSISFIFNQAAKRKKKEDEFTQNLANLTDTQLKVLPFVTMVELSDIFPAANNVAQWSIYIVGKNKQILLCQDNLGLSGDSLLNQKYNNVLRGPNAEFFDTVFNAIVTGVEKAFLIVQNEKLNFANIYSFRNASGVVTGGVLFVRLYTSMQVEIESMHNSERKSTSMDNERRKPDTQI